MQHDKSITLLEKEKEKGSSRGRLSLTQISKAYAGTKVLDSFSVSIEPGEFVSLLGPSGCGKTTTLNSIAGFVTTDSGSIVLDQRDITSVAPNLRDTAMVFQQYALFPHLRVAENVAYGLKVRKIPKQQVLDRVAETLAMVGISELADRYPSQLSGGQQQRVAVARAVSVNPAVLLMDEPLSNLDAKLRDDIRVELRALQQRLDQTVVFVTHDQREALSLSDRIVVMNAGKVEQIGTPEEIYNSPSTRFVAGFMGVSNMLDGTVLGSVFESVEGHRFPISISSTRSGNGSVSLGFRPSSVSLIPFDVSGGNSSVPSEPWGYVVSRSYLGEHVRLEVDLAGSGRRMHCDSKVCDVVPLVGAAVIVHIDPQEVVLLDS